MKKKSPKKEIGLFFHCSKCMPKYENETYYQNIECGWTKKGFQAWCRECDKSIIHIDFMGQKVRVADEVD